MSAPLRPQDSADDPQEFEPHVVVDARPVAERLGATATAVEDLYLPEPDIREFYNELGVGD